MILTVPHPNEQHHGGSLHWGDDGYFYMSFGDGERSNGPLNRAQDPKQIYGKILRLDLRMTFPKMIKKIMVFHMIIHIQMELSGHPKFGHEV